MLDPKDEEWLEKALKDCFEDRSDSIANEIDLNGFRILVCNLVRNIEKEVEEARALWELTPDSKELRKKFYLLKKHLFYLRRFCLRR